MSIFGHKDAFGGDKGSAWPKIEGPYQEVKMNGAELASTAANLTADKVATDAIPAAQKLVAEAVTPTATEAEPTPVPEAPALVDIPSLGTEPMVTTGTADSGESTTVTTPAAETAPAPVAASDDLTLPTTPTSELDSTAVSTVVDVPAPNSATPGPQEVAPVTTTTPPAGTFQG